MVLLALSQDMYSALFIAFLESNDTLQVYHDSRLIFSSTKDRLQPLIDYIDGCVHHQQPAVLFDRVTGNAAALLCVRAGCGDVYSSVGSQPAVETLVQHGIKHHFREIVARITGRDGEMCPMERLSIGKAPDEFYRLVFPYGRPAQGIPPENRVC